MEPLPRAQLWLWPNYPVSPWSRLSVWHSSLTSNNGRMLVMNTAAIWRATLERIEKSQIDAASKAWLQDAHLIYFLYPEDDDIEELADQAQEQDVQLTLQLPNPLARDVIKNRWQSSLEELLRDVTGLAITLAVSDAESAEKGDIPPPPS